MAVSRVDGEEELDGRPMALSDTELEINERHSSWKQGSIRRKEVSTKVSHTPFLSSLPCGYYLSPSSTGRNKFPWRHGEHL